MEIILELELKSQTASLKHKVAEKQVDSLCLYVGRVYVMLQSCAFTWKNKKNQI